MNKHIHLNKGTMLISIAPLLAFHFPRTTRRWTSKRETLDVTVFWPNWPRKSRKQSSSTEIFSRPAPKPSGPELLSSEEETMPASKRGCVRAPSESPKRALSEAKSATSGLHRSVDVSAHTLQKDLLLIEDCEGRNVIRNHARLRLDDEAFGNQINDGNQSKHITRLATHNHAQYKPSELGSNWHGYKKKPTTWQSSMEQIAPTSCAQN